MVYTTTIQGITVTSNVPFDQTIPSGTLYTIDLHWSLPIADLEQLGYDIQHILNQQSFIDKLVAQGWNGTITNYTVFAYDPFTTRIAYRATSPWAYIVGAAVVLLLIDVGLYFVSNISMVLNTTGGQILLTVVAVTVAAAVGIFLYSFAKSPQVRQETYKTTASGIRYTREKVAPAVARGAVALAGV